jgi:hypothetical protein
MQPACPGPCNLLCHRHSWKIEAKSTAAAPLQESQATAPRFSVSGQCIAARHLGISSVMRLPGLTHHALTHGFTRDSDLQRFRFGHDALVKEPSARGVAQHACGTLKHGAECRGFSRSIVWRYCLFPVAGGRFDRVAGDGLAAAIGLGAITPFLERIYLFEAPHAATRRPRGGPLPKPERTGGQLHPMSHQLDPGVRVTVRRGRCMIVSRQSLQAAAMAFRNTCKSSNKIVAHRVAHAPWSFRHK